MHHARWLRHSNGNSPEEILLKRIVDDFGLPQLVNEPTRGSYLLGFASTDLNDVRVEILPGIADHKDLFSRISLSIPMSSSRSPDVWHFKNAAWGNLKCDLRNCNWSQLKFNILNDAVDYFLDVLYLKCEEHIPHGRLDIRKHSQP